jgi:hypothetical protein
MGKAIRVFRRTAATLMNNPGYSLRASKVAAPILGGSGAQNGGGVSPASPKQKSSHV